VSAETDPLDYVAVNRVERVGEEAQPEALPSEIAGFTMDGGAWFGMTDFDEAKMIVGPWLDE